MHMTAAESEEGGGACEREGEREREQDETHVMKTSLVSSRYIQHMPHSCLKSVTDGCHLFYSYFLSIFKQTIVQNQRNDEPNKHTEK